MSVPSYVINWEELLKLFEDKLEINVGDILPGDLEDYLRSQMGLIIDLLKQILELLKDKGVQKSKAFNKHIPAIVAPFELTHTFDEDILLTGITYSQSGWKYQDTWDLIVDGNMLFEQVGTKEIGESKALNVFFYVPAGRPVTIIFNNNSGNSRVVWFDFEYLGLDGYHHLPLPPMMGEIEVRYIQKSNNDVIYRKGLDLPYGPHKVYPTDLPSGYNLIGPEFKDVDISWSNPRPRVDFIIEPIETVPGEKPIYNEFDYLISMKWQSYSDADLDLIASVLSDQVDYTNKQHKDSEDNQMWLNYDYIRHNDITRQEGVEIITVLGFNNSKVDVYIKNFNRSSDLSEPTTIEIQNKDSKGNLHHMDILEIDSRHLISWRDEKIHLGTLYPGEDRFVKSNKSGIRSITKEELDEINKRYP